MLRKAGIRPLQQGFTLIELLIGLAVGSIVLTGVIFTWGLTIQSNAYILSVTALNNDMRSLMQVVTQDVRRARASNVNPLTVVINATSDCIVFNAHIAGQGQEAEVIPTIANGALVPSGYRLRNGSFEMWAHPSEVATTLDLSGEPEACDIQNNDEDATSNWFVILQNGDRGIQLDEFEVETAQSWCLSLDETEALPPAPNGRCADTDVNHVELLLITFTLTGAINVAGGEREFRFQDSVKIRNDRVIN